MKAELEKKSERCMFWPKCSKGDTCPFLHPKKNCKSFPNCWYGNRCLFIHPPCRFDNSCLKKKHCPFTHYGNSAPKRKPADSGPKPKLISHGSVDNLATMLASFSLDKEISEKFETSEENKKVIKSEIPCRYAGRCRNATCRFKHPKECRFGINCRNANCVFYHKPTEMGDRYKWTAQ